MRVKNAKGREGRLAWKTLADEAGRIRLAYGEVMTTHTAQGSTATEHIYALPSGSQAVTGFAAYSSGTRHRRASYLVISEGAEKAEVARSRPLNDIRPIRAEDAWANVATNFSRQPTKELAIDFLAKAGSVRRGAARALQDGLRPIERQGGITHLHRTFARKQETDALSPVIAALERTVRGSARSSSGSRSWVRRWHRPCGTGSSTCAGLPGTGARGRGSVFKIALRARDRRSGGTPRTIRPDR